MTDTATTGPPQTSVHSAVFGASFGFFVDMYDVYLPVVALTPAMNYFLPASVSTGDRAVITSLIFVATLIGRPLGSVIFGHLADRVGRRKVTLWSVLGCGVCTLLLAMLPGYPRHVRPKSHPPLLPQSPCALRGGGVWVACRGFCRAPADAGGCSESEGRRRERRGRALITAVPGEVASLLPVAAPLLMPIELDSAVLC